MVEDRNFDIKVGLFVAMGIIIFFILVFSIGDINFVKDGYRIKTDFDFIDGVTTSAPVRYAGVDVGYVDSINIVRPSASEKTRVEVGIYVYNKSREIEKDAVASINTLGLLGEKYIEIFPGNPQTGFVAEGEALPSRDPIMMKDVTNRLNKLAESAGVIIERLREGKGTVGKLLTDETIYNDLEAFVADIKAHPWKLLSKPRGK